MYDLLIIGGGPAGLTAALYARRAGKTALVLERSAFGGQITASPRVENYPGLGAVSGLEFADRLVEQVLSLGAELESDEVTAIRSTPSGWAVDTASGGVWEGKALIAATGASPRPLGTQWEAQWVGRGVSYCAVCDGAFYKGRPVAVIGGGNSALQEALFLSDLCSRVYLIHRGAAFRGEPKLAQALSARENVTVLLNSQVTELTGSSQPEGVTVTNGDGQARALAVDGIFIAVGHQPETALLSSLVTRDESGCIPAGEHCRTALPGLFVAGDCRAKDVRQLTTAVCDGAVSALAACRHLDEC